MRTTLAVVVSCIALAAAAGLNGCSRDRAAVQVQAICFPTDTCKFNSRCDTYFGGPAGMAGPGTLVLFLQVANQLPNNENLGIGRLNTNDAHVEEIAVDYEGAQSNTEREGANSYIPAGGSAIVPVGLGIVAPGNTVARLRMIGHFDDGTDFETSEFPIAVSAGGGACGGCGGAVATCPVGGELQCPVACGDSGPVVTYTIGGTISGLTTSGLVLATTGLPDLSVTAGATSFTFANGVADGTAYSVTIRTQPTGQTCSFTPTTSASGTVNGANVTSVTITCA